MSPEEILKMMDVYTVPVGCDNCGKRFNVSVPRGIPLESDGTGGGLVHATNKANTNLDRKYVDCPNCGCGKVSRRII